MEVSPKGFNELHITLRGLLTGIILVCPFWYLDLYLFKLDYFESQYIQIPVIASFCLTVVWLLLNHISALCFDEYIFEGVDQIKGHAPVEHPRVVSFGVVFSVLHLAFISYITYYFKWSFSFLIYLSFSSVLIRIVFWRIVISSKKDPEPQKK